MLLSFFLLTLLLGCENDNRANYENLNTSNSYIDSNIPIKESSKFKTQFLNTEFSNIITLDSVNKDGTLRAQTNTDFGELIVVANGKEEVGHLNAPSVAGLEGDLTFQGNYTVINIIDGKKHEVMELKEITFIQQSDRVVNFDKVSFNDADVYFLTPQYTSGHGLNAYAIAVNKSNGEAISLKFIKNDTTTDTLNYANDQLPVNENEFLKVVPGISAGTSEENADITFYKLDLTNKYFIVE